MVTAAPATADNRPRQRPSWHGLELDRIERALADAERTTSAEIRVALSRWYFWGDIRGAARRAFRRLGMTATVRRNGVLLFLALRRREFALLGDVAVEEKLDPAAWERVAAPLRDRLGRGDLAGGIEAAVAALGHELAQHFPPPEDPKDDPNELSDKVVTDSR